jgi:6-phosphofructokinase 2
MQSVLTLTLNPAVDLTTSVDAVQPEHKLRCHASTRDPGGGGLNVARVVRELGGEVSAAWLRGGATGTLLEELIEREQLAHHPIPIAAPVRENVTVMEEHTGAQYRFTLEGPEVTPDEVESVLRFLESVRPAPGYLVLSGSLPEGVPADLYVQIARHAAEETRVVVDTSGDALAALRGSGVFLLKPNLRELSLLVGEELESDEQVRDAARALIDQGTTEVALISMGARGARVVSRDHDVRLHVPPVRPKSKVGAGDSTVGGMVAALARGDDLVTAARFGVAAGTAAVLTPGTQLCTREDTERIFGNMR